MAADPILPRQQSPFLDRNGFTAGEWYDFFRELLGLVADDAALTAEIEAMLLRLDALEAAGVGTISGPNSVQVFGSLSAGLVTLMLQGDVGAPGNTYYYGTGPTGDKTYHTVASAFTATQAGIELVTAADGITDIRPDDDLQAIEALTGVGFPARIDDDTWALREIEGTAGQVQLFNGDGVGDNPRVGLPALVLASLARADSAVQSVVAGANITVDDTDPQNPIVAATGGGSVPTGTGFVHITAGVQDAAAKLVDTADVNNDQITYAKIQNVSATSRILLRKTAGAGDVEEGTLSELLDFFGSAAHGDILYRDSAAWAYLPAGTSGDVLTTQGAGADPIWSAGGGGGMTDPHVEEYFCTHFAHSSFLSSTNTGTTFTTAAATVAYVGGATGAASITAASGRPGQALLITGTNAGGYARMCVSAGLAYVPGGGVTRYGVQFSLPALSNGTNRYQWNMGFLDVISGATTNRIDVVYQDDINSGNWRLRVINGGVTTNVDTATVGPVAATETFLEIEINAAGTSVEFFADGVSMATASITITAPLALFVTINKSVGTTSRTCLVNFCEFRQTFTTPR